MSQKFGRGKLTNCLPNVIATIQSTIDFDVIRRLRDGKFTTP